MGAAMAQKDHRLISTPVSVSDGFKRADGQTWFVLLIGAAVAVAVVAIIQLAVDKPAKTQWPTSPTEAPAAAPAPEEPRTYDVAPPGALPPTPG